MIPARKALLETRDGYDVGRDPRQVSREELIAAGHTPMSAQKALRLRCLDCCAGSAQEVRLCTAVACPAWPFRTGTNVWRAPASEARREWGRRLGKKTAAGAPKAFSEKAEIKTPDVSAATPPYRRRQRRAERPALSRMFRRRAKPPLMRGPPDERGHATAARGRCRRAPRARLRAPEESFAAIAARWSLVLGIEISPAQVALCLIDLKLARLTRDPAAHLDSIVDVAGYAACLREVTCA